MATSGKRISEITPQFNSHTIWHVFVLLGIGSHYLAMEQIIKSRLEEKCIA